MFPGPTIIWLYSSGSLPYLPVCSPVHIYICSPDPIILYLHRCPVPMAMTMLTYLASCVSDSTVLLCFISSIIFILSSIHFLPLQHDMWRSIIRPYVVRFPVNFANIMQDATRRDNGWNRADVVFHLLSQQTTSPLQPPECILDTHSCPAQRVVKVALCLVPQDTLSLPRIANYGNRNVNVSITLWPVGEKNSSFSSCIYRRVRKNSRVMNLARPTHIYVPNPVSMVAYRLQDDRVPPFAIVVVVPISYKMPYYSQGHTTSNEQIFRNPTHFVFGSKKIEQDPRTKCVGHHPI